MAKVWWHPPHYVPSLDELKRAYERMVRERAASDPSLAHLPDKDRELAIRALGPVACPWPEYADPADLKRLGFEE